MASITETLLTDIEHKRDFIKVTSGGDLMSISGLENILQAIIRRIITTPGSLAHRPNYGCGLKDFQNAPLTLATQRELAARLQEQLPLDPRISEVTSLSVIPANNNPSLVRISVGVKLVGYDEEVGIEIPFGEVF